MDFLKDAESLTLGNYQALKSACNEISEYIAENDCDREAIKGGKYSAEGIKEINSGINARNQKIREIKQAIDVSLSAKIDSFVSSHTPQLDPNEITDDTKFLNCGVTLKEKEVLSLLERNSGNYTMTTLLLRYAEEKGLKLDNSIVGKFIMNTGIDRLREYIRAERERVHYSLEWIDKPNNGLISINRFYGVET